MNPESFGIIITYLDKTEIKISSLLDIHNSEDVVKIVGIRCHIESLYELPRNLPNLESLTFWECYITSLEGIPQELPKLEELCCIRAKLTSLQGLPSNLPNLTCLQFSVNKITIINIPYYPNLSKIVGFYNPIKYFYGYALYEQIKRCGYNFGDSYMSAEPNCYFGADSTYKKFKFKPHKTLIKLSLAGTTYPENIRSLQKHYNNCQKCNKKSILLTHWLYLDTNPIGERNHNKFKYGILPFKCKLCYDCITTTLI